jgi:hypothetical protein
MLIVKQKFIIIYLALFGFPFYAVALDNAGKTIIANGQVEAKNSQQYRALLRRSPVFKQDLVQTGNESNTQLRMIDGGLLALEQLTQLQINDYRFNEKTNEGNVSLKLIKGGLRTITGSLKSHSHQYNLLTPIASIGVRGTHFEAELIKDDLYLAVWEGLIDIKVLVGTSPQTFSLGEGEDYKFAIVRKNGEVEFILSTPVVFAKGQSTSLPPNDLLLAGYNEKPTPSSTSPVISQANAISNKQLLVDETFYIANPDFNITGNSLIDNDRTWSLFTPDTSIVAQRSGEVIFDHVLTHSVNSNLGDISNFAMSMTINFDTARIPTGQLSFSDQAGQWFSTFNGVMGKDAMELSIKFAEHNNNPANGFINAILLNNASLVFGEFSLTEINSTINTAGGGFVLSEKP